MEFHQNIADGLLFHNICIQVTQSDNKFLGQFVHRDTESPLCCHVVPLHDLTTYLMEQRKFGHWICKHCDPLFVNLLRLQIPNIKHVRPVLEFTQVFKNRLLVTKERIGYDLIQGNLGDKRKLDSEEDEDSSSKRVKTSKEEEEKEDLEAIETLLSNIDSNPVAFFHYAVDQSKKTKDYDYGAGLMDRELSQFNALSIQRRDKIDKTSPHYRNHRVLSYIEEERKELKEFEDTLEHIEELRSELNWKVLMRNTKISTILEDNDPERCQKSFYDSLRNMPMMILLQVPRTGDIEVDCLMLLSALSPYFLPPSIRKYQHLKNLINTMQTKIVSELRLLYVLQSPEMEYMMYRKYLKMDPPSLIELRQNLHPSIQISAQTSTNMPGYSRKEPNYTLQLKPKGSEYIKKYNTFTLSSKREGLEGKYNVDFYGDVLYYAPKNVNDFVFKKWKKNTDAYNKSNEDRVIEAMRKNPNFFKDMTLEQIHHANVTLYNWYKEFSYIYERNQEMIIGDSQILDIRRYTRIKMSDDYGNDNMPVFDIRINRECENVYGNTTSIPTEWIETYVVNRTGPQSTTIEWIENYIMRPIASLSIPIHDIDIKNTNILKIDARSPQEDFFRRLYLTFPKDQFNDRDVSEALQRQDDLETMIEEKALNNNFRNIKELCLVGMRNIDLTNHGLDQIRKFENLESLSIVDSCIMTIPPYLRDMQSLKNLYIQRGPKENGKFSKNDNFYGLLPNVKVIILANIQCSSLFNHLMSLDSVEESKLTILSIERGHKRVFIDYDHLETSPMTVPLSEPNSRQRNKLTLKKNILMRWNVIGNVTNLSLIDCNLDFIPYMVGTLKKLSHLDLARNNIQTWVEITNARYADKGGMYVGFLRHNLNVISELPMLESLNLSENGLKVVPFGLLTVSKRIKHINLTRNPINVSNLGNPRHKYFDRDIIRFVKDADDVIDSRFKVDQSVSEVIQKMSVERYRQLYSMATTFDMNLLDEFDVKDIRLEIGHECFDPRHDEIRVNIILRRMDYNYSGNLKIRHGGEHAINVDNLPDSEQNVFKHMISYGTKEEEYDPDTFSSSRKEYASTEDQEYIADKRVPHDLFPVIYSSQGKKDMMEDDSLYSVPDYTQSDHEIERVPTHMKVDNGTVIDITKRWKMLSKLDKTSGYQQDVIFHNKVANDSSSSKSTSTKDFYFGFYKQELPILSSRVQGEVAFETINIKRFVDKVTKEGHRSNLKLRHY